MDRANLAAWSAPLADEAFPLALAALGVLAGLARKEPDRLYGADGWRVKALPERFTAMMGAHEGILHWEWPLIPAATGIPQIPLALARLRGAVPFPEATTLATAWTDFLKSCAASTATTRIGPRLAIQTTSKTIAQTISIARLLAQPAVGAASVYLDGVFTTTARTAWCWPFTVATLPDDPLAELFAGLQQQLSDGSPFSLLTATQPAPQTEIFVSSVGVSETVARLLAANLRLRCRLVIVGGLGMLPTQDPMPPLALAAKTSATGMAVLDVGYTTQEFADRLLSFSSGLASGESLDRALTAAFQPGLLLFLNRDSFSLHNIDSGFIRVAKTLSRPMNTRGIALDMADSVPPPLTDSPAKEPRYVQQRSYREQNGNFIQERSSYIVDQPTLVHIYIGTKQADSIAAPDAFPDHLLPPDVDNHRLQVVFHEARQFDEPMVADITLPRQGNSRCAAFSFTPRQEGAFAGRIWIVYQQRILQICVLRTHVFKDQNAASTVVSSIILDRDIQVRSDWSNLEKRRPFDLALELGCPHSEQPMLTGITGQRAWSINLDDIKDPVRSINELISAVAYSVDDYSQGLDQGKNPELLVKLARKGVALYSVLKEQLTALLTERDHGGDSGMTHLQMVSTHPDAVIPLEFIYEFEPPERTATVCPNHRDALQAGRCPKNCPRSLAPNQHICPMGFWGLNKVIERHLYDPRKTSSDGASFNILAEPVAGRDQLPLRSGALLAYSQEVEPTEITTLIEKLRPNVVIAKDWDDWKQAIQDKHPALLIAFPHNQVDDSDIFLEIGGKELDTLGLNSDYVRAAETAAPLVFLLGCDTASTAISGLSNPIRYFRQAGAAVIVSTIATVFGVHAVQVGDAIISRLLQAGGTESLTIGDAIREAKCAALRESLPMALCVMAFGDADWRL